VPEMRDQRWEATGGAPESRPREADPVAPEPDDDFSSSEDDRLPATISESLGEVHGDDDDLDDESDREPRDRAAKDSPTTHTAADSPAGAAVRPFAALPQLPSDMNEAFELFKLAILNHKVSGWREIARDDVLAVLESLRQLALAPAE
jgi:hypothetical protein